MPPTDQLVDFERPARLAARQGPALAHHVATEVHPYSRLDRSRLDRAGLGADGIRSVADLRRLPPISVEELGDGAAATLRPSPDLLRTVAPWRVRVRWWLAGLAGRRGRMVADELDPTFKPIVWLRQDRLLVGCTTADLDRLGELGRRWLAAAGVRADDRVVALGGLADGLAAWQLSLGCRAGGVAATVVDERGFERDLEVDRRRAAGSLALLEATALAASAGALDRLVGVGLRLDHLRTVLVLDALPSPAQRRRWAALSADEGAAVLGAWAPPGVRALWGQCRGGALHTWPDAEVLEVIDPLTGEPTTTAAEDGELVWSPIGWRGTAALRLATGAFGHLDAGRCPDCGRTTPRLSVLDLDPAFAVLLDTHPAVVEWWAHTGEGRLRVVVALRRGAPVGEVVAALAADLDADVERAAVAKVRLLRAESGGHRIARAEPGPGDPGPGAVEAAGEARR